MPRECAYLYFYETHLCSYTPKLIVFIPSNKGVNSYLEQLINVFRGQQLVARSTVNS